MNTQESITAALYEAYILESIQDPLNIERMLMTAMRLSGAPWSFIVEIFQKDSSKYVRATNIYA